MNDPPLPQHSAPRIRLAFTLAVLLVAALAALALVQSAVNGASRNADPQLPTAALEKFGDAATPSPPLPGERAGVRGLKRTGPSSPRRLSGKVGVTGTAPAHPIATGWPNLFGPTHDSRTPQPIHVAWSAAGPPELWRLPIGAGYSSPIVVGDRVILLHRLENEEVVSCLSADTGRSLWEHRYPTSFVCGSHYTSGPYSTPASDGERVVTLGAQGQLHCLRLADGRVLWQRETSAEFRVEPDIFGVGHSPLIVGGRAILNIGGRAPQSGIIAFDAASGAIVWQATDHGPSYATPQPALIHGRERLFVLTKSGLVMLDPQVGRVFWEVPYSTRIPDGYAAVTPVVSGDLVFVSLFGRGSLCLRVHEDDSYSTLWDDRRRLTSQYNPVLTADGCVYGVHSTDKSFRCLDLGSGEVRWRWKTPLGRSTHLIAGRHILLFGEFGELGVIDVDARQPVARAMTTRSLFDGERCFSAPALCDGRLYLRNERELVCLDLRPAAQ